MDSNVLGGGCVMKNNKVLLLMMMMILTLALAVGCSQPAEEPAAEPAQPVAEAPAEDTEEATEMSEDMMYADGTYFAMEDKFSENSGWKGAVVIEVKDGKFTSINWTGVSNKGGLDKKETSKNGGYPMVAAGGAQAEWYEQAAKVEAYLMETQDVKAITYKDDEGHTDAISGVSIHVNDFYALAEKALAAGPAERGMYKDGAYTAEEAAFANGWKGNVSITVFYGHIAAVNWNGTNEENPELDKKTASMEGQYPMVENAGAQAPWHEQAMKAEMHLLMTQDPTDINYIDDEGHTDSISGVSIHVNDFYKLVEEALKGAM